MITNRQPSATTPRGATHPTMMELAYNDMRPLDAQYSTMWDGLATAKQEFAGSPQSIISHVTYSEVGWRAQPISILEA